MCRRPAKTPRSHHISTLQRIPAILGHLGLSNQLRWDTGRQQNISEEWVICRWKREQLHVVPCWIRIWGDYNESMSILSNRLTGAEAMQNYTKAGQIILMKDALWKAIEVFKSGRFEANLRDIWWLCLMLSRAEAIYLCDCATDPTASKLIWHQISDSSARYLTAKAGDACQSLRRQDFGWNWWEQGNQLKQVTSKRNSKEGKKL